MKKYSETKEEFVTNLINRKNPRALSQGSGMCTYSHNYNGGCAIGCEVDEDTANELQRKIGAINELGMSMLPKRLQDMGIDFLTDAQKIHDRAAHWLNHNTGQTGDNGLVWSRAGLKAINRLINEYNVNIPTVVIPEELD